MKVLHINSNISKRSGIMSCIMNYYRHFDRTIIQFDFMFFENREETYADEIRKLGGNITKVNSPKNLILFLKDIKEFCNNHYHEYDIIEIHDPFMFSFLGKIKNSIGAKCVIAHGHSTKFSDHMIGEIRNRMLSLAARVIPDYYFACSDVAGEKMFGGSRFRQKGKVIYNAIDLSRFQVDRKDTEELLNELNIKDKYIVGHIGNFNEAKNHEFIIEIYNEIIKDRPNSVLILVGDGELKANIQEKCKKLKIESKVLFLGIRSDIPVILSLFDVFVFPSKYEGLGIALIEAQAANVPCICSDRIPHEALVINVKALSLEDSVTSWKEALFASFKGNRGEAFDTLRVAGFDINNESTKLMAVYEQLVNMV